jgi:hypothetical protein
VDNYLIDIAILFFYFIIKKNSLKTPKIKVMEKTLLVGLVIIITIIGLSLLIHRITKKQKEENEIR